MPNPADNFVDVEQPILLKVEPIDNEPVDYDIYVEPVDIGWDILRLSDYNLQYHHFL